LTGEILEVEVAPFDREAIGPDLEEGVALAPVEQWDVAGAGTHFVVAGMRCPWHRWMKIRKV